MPPRSDATLRILATAAAAALMIAACASPSTSSRSGSTGPASTPSSESGMPTGSPPAQPTSPPPASLEPPASPEPPPPPPPELPRGGRTLLPDYRLVAYYGTVGGPGLGVLGKGSPDEAAEALEQQAAAYAPYGRPVQPVMELITTVAQGAPGPDGSYSRGLAAEKVSAYLDAAHRHRQLLVLDFQPGTHDFLGQLQQYEQFLLDPSVGVALDPEWRIGPGEVPGQVIGAARASEINAAAAYLSGLAMANGLPQKLLILHQFRPSMLPDREAIAVQPGLAMVIHADGEGSIPAKLASYDALEIPATPFAAGFKVFYTRDPQTMTPDQVMALVPQPDLISYQ